MNPNKKPTPQKQIKKSYQIQFYPDIKQAGVDRAEELGISFQQYLENLILADLNK